MTIREVARSLGCSAWTVRQRYLPQGLPHFRSGPQGKLVFFRHQVIRWILERQQKGGKQMSLYKRGQRVLVGALDRRRAHMRSLETSKPPPGRDPRTALAATNCMRSASSSRIFKPEMPFARTLCDGSSPREM